ncbi:MAG: hypothetical protein OJF47_000243 [Nitrospira sp.]|jgi:hypothetical protein|nr:MAG: hypothetical protein OJF47_000243 [Nitrospira sp.]
MEIPSKRYLVFKGDQMVLEVTDRPGPMISKVAPPPLPGTGPKMHPFLSATAYVPEHERLLLQVLAGSRSVAEYVAKLTAFGYRVIEKAP